MVKMNIVLRAAAVVCVVCAATKSNAGPSLLKKEFRHLKGLEEVKTRCVEAGGLVCEPAEVSAMETAFVGGALRYWRNVDDRDIKIEYSEANELGGRSAEISIDGIEAALGVACKLLESGQSNTEQIAAIRRFVKGGGHRDYNDGTPEAQNFAVMVVRLTGMMAMDGAVRTYCDKCLERKKRSNSMVAGTWEVCVARSNRGLRSIRRRLQS
jgi:hypothetical protein